MKYFCTEVYQAKIGILLFLKSSLNLVGNFNFKLDNYIQFSCSCFVFWGKEFRIFCKDEEAVAFMTHWIRIKDNQGPCRGQS